MKTECRESMERFQFPRGALLLSHPGESEKHPGMVRDGPQQIKIVMPKSRPIKLPAQRDEAHELTLGSNGYIQDGVGRSQCLIMRGVGSLCADCSQVVGIHRLFALHQLGNERVGVLQRWGPWFDIEGPHLVILAVCFVPYPNRKADRAKSPTQQLEETIKHLLAGCTQAEGLRDLQPFGAIIIFRPVEVPRNELSRAVPRCA